MVPAVGTRFSFSCYILFKGRGERSHLVSRGLYSFFFFFFLREGHGNGRVGIDGCWQLLDKVYDVFTAWFSGNGVYGFLLQIFLPDIMISAVGLSRVCCVA